MDDIKRTIRKINMGLPVSKSDSSVISFVTINESNSQPTVIANLAIMYARANEKVVILDTNFKTDSFVSAFNLKKEKGLSDYLNDVSVEEMEILQKVSEQNISVITSGSLNIEETHLLVGDPRMADLLIKLKKHYNRILINMPVWGLDDGYMNLFKASDGVILINDLEYTSKKDLFRLVNELDKNEIEILGYVSAKR